MCTYSRCSCALSCKEVDPACLTSRSVTLNGYTTDAALVLDASTRVAAAAQDAASYRSALAPHSIFPFSRLLCRPFSCTRVDTVLATDMLARQDAAPELYASIGVSDAVTARSGVLEHVHVQGVVEPTSCARVQQAKETSSPSEHKRFELTRSVLDAVWSAGACTARSRYSSI